MRERVIIAAVVAVVIGVVVLLEREPEPGTIAWHKREYFADRFPVTWSDRVRDKWERLRGQPVSKNLALLESSAGWEARQHVYALHKLGYFHSRGVKLPYSPYPNSPGRRMSVKAQEKLPKNRIWWIETIDEPVDGYCVVWYEPRDAARWDKIISEVKTETK